MKSLFHILLAMTAGYLGAPVLQAADAAAVPPPSAPAKRSAAELQKLTESIALYPDPLISIILPASAYPLEVVQAARFVKDTNNIPKIGQQPWDSNVKALAEFPDVLAKMDADLSWTVALGQAFIEQPKDLMDAIQSLRTKAQQAGTLRTTAQQVVTVTNVVVLQTNVTQVVTVTNTVIQVVPANPQVIYVPTYPPTVYYPPPGYVYNPMAPLVTFGMGVAVGAIIANNCDWHGGCVWVGHGGVWVGGGHGDVDIDIDKNVNINRGDRNVNVDGSRNQGGRAETRPAQTKWQPDQGRLNNSGAGGPATREARGWGSASTQPAQMPGGAGAARPAQQPSYNFSQKPPSATQPGRTPVAGQPAQRPSTPNVGQPAQRPAAPSAGSRPTTTWQQPSGSRPQAPSPSVNRSSSGSSAFGGVGSGSSTRSASSRGSFSRGGGGGSRGGGGRGR